MEETKILDHGYVRLIESWGSDERIIEAARMSTQKGFDGWGPIDLGACFDCTAAGGPRNPGSRHGYEGSSDWCLGGRRQKSGDEKLLAFLWKNRHTTPFEMAGAIIEVQAPIFVFREWHRHRMQCLAGDTMIACVTPNGTTYQRSIRSIFELKHGGVVDTAPARHKNGTTRQGKPATREARRKDPWRTRILPNCQSRELRVLNEVSGEFTTARMADVWESGVKALWVVETNTGRTIKASAEHPFFCRFKGARGGAFEKLKNLKPGTEIARMGKIAANERPIPPSLRQGIGVWTTMMRSRIIRLQDTCYLCERLFEASELELDHVIPVVENLLLALDPSNLKPVCTRCHRNKTNAEQPSRIGMSKRGIRWETVVRVAKTHTEEMTYDIEVDGPHHNYVANGLVVHNSYNEMSARYTPLPDVNYTPTTDRMLGRAPGQIGHPHNKQAGTIKDAEVLTLASSLEWLAELAEVYEHAERVYQSGLKRGVPKELARLPVPVARYSRMRAQAVLLNWFRFAGLRSDMNFGAQWEIRQYANAVLDLLEQLFPRSASLMREKPL